MYQDIISKYYESESRLGEILIHHSRQVADRSLEIMRRLNLPLNPDEVETAAMLHDIGIFLTDAKEICCMGDKPYILHGILGAELLRRDGIDEGIARVAERHTGAGLMAFQLAEAAGKKYAHLVDTSHDYLPETILEKLVCYADKFYSKSGEMSEKSLERVIASMAHHGADSLERFLKLHSQFQL